METKKCTGCGSELPATSEYFNLNKKTKDGFYPRCRDCRKAYRDANRDKILEQKRRHYYANHEQVLEQKRRTYAQHGEVYRERLRQKWAANRETMNQKRGVYRAANYDRIRKYNREWELRNPERVREHARRTYLKHREKRLQQERLERLRNPEKYRARKRRYYLANRTAHLRKSREYFARNPHLRKMHYENRQARVRNLPHTLKVRDWQFALDYFNGCCAICGRQLRDLFSTHTAAADHWIPLSDPRPDNPGTVPWNIVPLCHGEGGCNNRKGNRDPIEFLKSEFGNRAKAIQKRIENFFTVVG